MSGGRSSSRSNSTNVNETDNSNTQINDTEGLVLNFEGSENNEATIIQSDQGAITESFNFGESALDRIDDVVANSLDTVEDTTARAFDFGGDALDESFDFGNRALAFGNTAVEGALAFGSDALEDSQDFGRDVLNEAQEITRSALSIAGNAQTNAFSKIREIAESFTTGTSTTTRTLLIAFGIAGVVVAVTVLIRTRKS